ncbi:MAG: ATP-binding protein [Candidatus Hydrogenedentota bacterium]
MSRDRYAPRRNPETHGEVDPAVMAAGDRPDGGSAAGATDGAAAADRPVEPITGRPVSPLVLAMMAVPVSVLILASTEILEHALFPNLDFQQMHMLHFIRGLLLSLLFAFLGSWAVSRNWTRSLHRIRVAETRARRAEIERMERRRLAALGRMAAGFAHEIRNPLAVISGNAQLLSMKGAQSRAEERIGHIMTGVARIDSIVHRLFQIVRRAVPAISDVPVESAVDVVLDIVKQDGSAEGISIETEISPRALALRSADGNLEQIILPILRNALDAVRTGSQQPSHPEKIGCIRISARPSGEGIVLEISDNGPGIPPDVRSHVLAPFFTTKEIGQGTGLGLSIVHAFVREAGGRIEIDESEWKGALVRVHIPAEQEE